MIKSALGALGHYDAPEWGVSQFPDSDLFQAIKAFQKTHKLKADGVIKPDGETLAALQAKLQDRAGESATQTAAQALQDLGRNGDTLLAHITQDEAQLLHDITDGGSINPETGLLEFYRSSGAMRDRGPGAEARDRAAATDRAARGSQRSGDWDSSKGRTLGYNDFLPGASNGDRNLNGTPRSGKELARHNRTVAKNNADKAAAEAKAKQAKAQQVEADRQAKAKLDAAKQHQLNAGERARSLGALHQGGNEEKGMLSQKTNPNQARPISEDRPTATTNTTAQPTQAPSAQPKRNQSVSSPFASRTMPNKLPGSAPGVTGSATPAEQVRNVKAHQAYQEKQAKAEAKAKDGNLFAGIDFGDLLGTSKPRNAFGLSVQVADASGNMSHATSLLGDKPKGHTYTSAQLAGATQTKASTKITHDRIKSWLDSKRAHKSAGVTFTAAAQKSAWNQAKESYPSGARAEAGQQAPRNMLRYPGLPPRKPSLSFNDAIALREVKDLPNGGYDAVAGNPNIKKDFALGRYQMRSSALEATHYLDENGTWANKDGINSYRDFLDSPTVQEKAIKEYHGVLGKELSNNGSTKHLGKKIDGIKAKITITRSGLVAAAHRQGARKVREYLKHMSGNGWKSDFNDLDKETRKEYLSVETRLREFQNRPLP